MNKKAITHLEMIISFLIFFMSFFFLFLFLNPIRQEDLSTVILQTVEYGIKENASLYLTEVPVILNILPGSSCFSVINPFQTTIPEENILITDMNEQFVGFRKSGSNLDIMTNGKFYLIATAEEDLSSYNPWSGDSCTTLNEEDYAYSAPRIYEALSVFRLNSLKQGYENSETYSEIKKKFAIPDNIDFSINVTSDTEIISMTRQKPAQVVVKAETIPVELLYQGKVIKAWMNIQIW